MSTSTVSRKSRKAPTEEQKAAAAERRERIRLIAKTVSAMNEFERVELSMKFGGIVTVEGRQLSIFNTCLLISQAEHVTMVGGFAQWFKAGRTVRKGERGLAIWIPTSSREEQPDSGELEENSGSSRQRFILGTVFDISQTDEKGA